VGFLFKLPSVFEIAVMVLSEEFWSLKLPSVFAVAADGLSEEF